MKKIAIFTLFLLFMGCAATKPATVPIQSETIIEYRDTTIYLEKVIEVPVPVERVVEVVPRFDTLRMETGVAKAECWADTTNRVLRGRMENKQTALKGKIDTCFVVEYVDRYTEKEVAVEVPVDVPYIPKFAWLCIIFTCCWAVLKIAKIIWKLKGLK
jgi:hypothetical protein